MNEKRIIATLKNYNISETAKEVGTKIGFNRIISLIRDDKLYSEYLDECCQWVQDNPQIKEEMIEFEPFESFFDKDDGSGEKDVGLILDSIIIHDMLEIIEQNDCGEMPTMLKAVVEVASKDTDAWNLEDCTIIGIGEDYLREIEYFLGILGLVPAT